MIWNKSIPRADRTLKMSNYVCELHFQPECVDKTYSTVLSDGSLFTMDRGIPLLKSGSVPTIFPNLPKYLSHTIKKRKSPKKRSLSAQKRQKPNQFEPNRTSQNNFENVTIARELFSTNETPLISFTFDDLKNGLKCLNLPNSSWAYCCTNSNIIFSRWREVKNDIIAAVGIKLNLKVKNYIYFIFYCIFTDSGSLSLQNSRNKLHTLSTN